MTGVVAVEQYSQKICYSIAETGTAETGTTGTTPIDTKHFQALVGRLLFMARMWRPDIRYAVQRLCIHASKPMQHDMLRAERLVSYLLSTAKDGIILRPFNLKIDIYSDAGEEDLEEKATSGILTMASPSPISWVSRKQDVTTLSSTEAEYIALGVGAQDALWISKILAFLCNPVTPRVWSDNQGASTLSYNPDFQKRTKHIRRRHHFVRECVTEGDITVHWVPGESNPADMLTTALSAMFHITFLFRYAFSSAFSVPSDYLHHLPSYSNSSGRGVRCCRMIRRCRMIRCRR